MKMKKIKANPPTVAVTGDRGGKPSPEEKTERGYCI
jgi:hypothetical protein